MTENAEFIVEETGYTLKTYLSSALGFSRRAISRLNSAEALRVNGKRVPLSSALKKGDNLSIIKSGKEAGKLTSLTQKPDIIFQDAYVTVCYKPSGMPAHSSKEHLDDDLTTLLRKVCGNRIMAPVGRLDKDASGLMLFGNDHETLARLSKQKKGTLTKTYICAISGCPLEKEGMLVYGLEKDAYSHTYYLSEQGKKCRTKYQVLKRDDKHALLKVKITNGRQHQIRSGLAGFGWPIVGDSLYGGDRGLKRLALHALDLSFIHPYTGEKMFFETPIPQEIASLIR